MDKLPYTRTAGVRRAASVIGLTAIAEYGLNIMLFPLLAVFSGVEKGSFAYELGNMLLYLVVFVPPFYGLARLHGWTLRDLNGRGRPSAYVCVMTVCLTFGWNLIATYLAAEIELIMNGFGFTEGGSTYIEPLGAPAAVVMVISTAFIPPLVEELCYRGFLLKACRRSMEVWPAVILSSTAFWFAHDSITIFPLAFGFGILGGVLRTKYDSLLPSMLGHLAVNGSYIVINHANETLSRGSMLAFQGGVLTFELVCLCIGIAMAVRAGLFKTVKGYIAKSRGQSRAETVKGVFTSIPFLLLIAATVYLTLRGVETL